MHAPGSAVLHDDTGDQRCGLLAAAVIVLTTVSSLVLSHVRMMWADEFLSYWGDKLPTATDVVRVQLHYPISLDPPLYHLLAHWSMQVFGADALGMRAPALLGVILSQVALFFLVRRLAGSRAAVLAAALPAVFGPFWYSAEGRPYGWLLGMYALAMLCWVLATSDAVDRSRTLPLVGLALSIAGAITCHYFGVLILLPFAAGELVRTVDRKRIDWLVAAAIVVGAASLALILPFQHALLAFKLHYYNRHVTSEAITLGYKNSVSQSALVTRIFLLVIAVVGVRRFLKREPAESRGFWAMLLVLALMPLWCFLFERFVTHSMEGRYAIPASLAFVTVLALAFEAFLQRKTAFYGTLLAVVLLGLASIGVKVRREQLFRRDFMSDIALPPGVDLAGSRYIYINSFGNFLQDQYYAPPDIQSRLAYVYDAEEEIKYKGRDTHSISADNVRKYTPLQIIPYKAFLQDANPVFINYGVEDWEWLPQDLDARAIPVQPLGTLMLGRLEQANTHASGMAGPAMSR